MSSATGGLSRRRVVNVTDDSDAPAGPSTPTPSSDQKDKDPPRTANGHAGTALEGGHKIAYDPDEDALTDSRTTTASGKLPRLNLTEEVVLLGLKDKAGYLSFWNDSISYALRGCILLELALRKRIAVVNAPRRRQVALSDRVIEVVEERMTGETLLDEALKLIRDKAREGEKLGVNSWVDLMSGETWNVLKMSYQLKQVRERIQKGLVDKGLLSTSKTNFLLFDMATHPCTPLGISNKNAIVSRVNALLFSRSTAIPANALAEDGTQCRVTRSVALCAASYAASVLENALGQGRGVVLGFEEKEEALTRCDDMLTAFSTFPFNAPGTSTTGSSSSSAAAAVSSSAAASPRRRGGGSQGGSTADGQESIGLLTKEVMKELQMEGGESWELYAEVVAAVFEIWSRMDSIL